MINLEWCTYKHNTKEAYKNGLIKPGGHKVKLEQIDPNSNKIIKVWDSYKEVCNFLKIDGNLLRNIIKNKILYEGFRWQKFKKMDFNLEIWKPMDDYANYQTSKMNSAKSIANGNMNIGNGSPPKQ